MQPRHITNCSLDGYLHVLPYTEAEMDGFVLKCFAMLGLSDVLFAHTFKSCRHFSPYERIPATQCISPGAEQP